MEIFEVLIGTVVLIVGGAIGLTWILGGPFLFFAAWAKSGDILRWLIVEYPWFSTGTGRNVFKYGYQGLMFLLIFAWVGTIALLKGRS